MIVFVMMKYEMFSDNLAKLIKRSLGFASLVDERTAVVLPPGQLVSVVKVRLVPARVFEQIQSEL